MIFLLPRYVKVTSGGFGRGTDVDGTDSLVTAISARPMILIYTLSGICQVPLPGILWLIGANRDDATQLLPPIRKPPSLSGRRGNDVVLGAL